jgi:hypothetical protein
MDLIARMPDGRVWVRVGDFIVAGSPGLEACDPNVPPEVVRAMASEAAAQLFALFLKEIRQTSDRPSPPGMTRARAMTCPLQFLRVSTGEAFTVQARFAFGQVVVYGGGPTWLATAELAEEGYWDTVLGYSAEVN